MKKHVLTGIVSLHALAWAAATVQGVLLQISPKGVSMDAFLFGGVFGVLALFAATLAWAVHARKPAAIIIVTIGFGLVGVGGLLLGLPVTLMGFGAADSYVLPLGLLAMLGGGLHLGAAFLGGLVYRDLGTLEA